MISDKEMLKLPVYTESGLHLGKLIGFEFEIDSQIIVSYRVQPKGVASRILKSPLLVSREQVVSITKDKMVVEDNVEKEMELEKARAIGLVTHES